MTAGRLTENICGHAGFGWHAGWPPVVYVMDDGAWMVETMVSRRTLRVEMLSRRAPTRSVPVTCHLTRFGCNRTVTVSCVGSRCDVKPASRMSVDVLCTVVRLCIILAHYIYCIDTIRAQMARGNYTIA